jgi:hypothetical protein
MAKTKYTSARPLNVNVLPGSPVAKLCRSYAGLPGQVPTGEAIAPGLRPTPAQDLRFRGGKTIAQLTFTNFFVGGDQSWDANDRQSVDRALAAAMSDRNLNNVIMQYFNNQPITSTFKPSTVLPGSAPAVMSQGDVENLLRSLHVQGHLDNFDFGSTVFNFMLPRGTVLTDDAQPTGAANPRHAASARPKATANPAIPHEDQASSLLGLGGYHGSIHDGQVTLYYAVGVFSETRADGTTNGIPAFDQPWKNIVATFYHELNEARTDPDVEDAIRAGNDPNAEKFLGWTSDQGEECGDFPIDEASALTLVFKDVPLTDGTGTVPIQFQYSNAVHGPEGPIPAPHGHQRAILDLVNQLSALVRSSPAAVRALAAATTVRHLVYVHGICRHSAGFSDPWWAAVSADVPSLQPGDLDGNRHEVLWSDLVTPLRLAAARVGGEQAKVRDRIRATLQDRLERQRHDAIPQARGVARPQAMSAALGLPAIPGLDCIDDFLTYLFNDTVRTSILNRFHAVVRPLLQAGSQVEVISHSWGTVVAYEALRQLDNDPQMPAGAVLNFFTVGSALSIFEVQQNLLPTSSDGQRPRVVIRWINLNAHGDIVGGHLQDSPFQVDSEFLNLDPITCTAFLGIVDPSCAHSSYFQPENVAVNRDIFGSFIES